MKKKLLYFLLHPFVLAGLISAIIIWFLPDYFSKFKVDLVSSEFLNGEGTVVYYSDLDGDYKSEKIRANVNTLGNASFMIYKSNGDFIDQYNLEGKFSNISKKPWFQDANNDGLKEIYTVLIEEDSLFLNVIELRDNVNASVKRIYVDSIVPHKNDFYFRYSSFHDNFDKYNPALHEVVFAINSGFSCYPRKVYKYKYDNKSIISSPYLTNSIDFDCFYDLNDDGELEFLINVTSPGNDNALKYSTKSDYSNWVTVLDNELNYFFDPIEIKALGSLSLFPKTENKQKSIIGFFKSRKHQEIPSKLFEFDLNGKIIKEKSLNKSTYSSFFSFNSNNFLIYSPDEGMIKIFDGELELLDSLKILPQHALYQVSLNSDKDSNWIGLKSDNTSATIWDLNFRHPITFDLHGEKNNLNASGLRFLDKENIQLYFQKGNEINYFSYSENPKYYFKYLVYLGIYATILFLMWLIIKGQKLREAKKIAIEQKISDLQLKTIKNQVDPHFVFNAINTISEMTLMDNKLEADRFICEFSDLMRKTLNRSDKITTSLKDELSYVENYLRLQQMRHKHNFDFQIVVDKEVNIEQLIPKHAIYTFVENAVKYGLPRDIQGKIVVKALKDNDSLVLRIEDNGKGIEPEKEKKYSTGSGLKIIQQIFELYNKRFGIKIEHSLNTIKDENNTILGTLAEVIIRSKKVD